MRLLLVMLLFVLFSCSTEQKKDVSVDNRKDLVCLEPDKLLTIDLDSSFKLESDEGNSISHHKLYVRGKDKIGLLTYCIKCDSVERKITNELSYYRMFYNEIVDKGKYIIDTLKISNNKALLISMNPNLEHKFFELLFENIDECGYYVRISGLGITAETDSLLRKSISSIKLNN